MTIFIEKSGVVLIEKFITDLLQKVETVEQFKMDDHDISLLMAHLGDSDASLRDEGLYTLVALAVEKNCLNTVQLRRMKNQLLSKKYLFKGMQEDETDDIFWRSFSNLYLAVIVEYDRTKEHFMSTKELSEIALNLCCYLTLENDNRGFIEGKGWAHAFAHAGDLANELAKHPYLESSDLSLLTVTIFRKVTNFGKMFSFGEEERLIQSLLTILKKQPDFSVSIICLIEKQQIEIDKSKSKQELIHQNNYYNTRRFYQQFLLSSNTPSIVKQKLEKWSI